MWKWAVSSTDSVQKVDGTKASKSLSDFCYLDFASQTINFQNR